MDFDQFTDFIQKNILSGWKESASAEIHKVKKNNGIIYTGIHIRQNGEHVTPAIYLEVYYDRYRKGESVTDILQGIRAEYDWAMSRTSSYQFDLSDFSVVRDQLIYRLVNYDKNKEMLSACPHIRFLDLAVTFRWLAHEDSVGISTALVTDQEMEMWNVTTEDLYNAAKANTCRIFPEQIVGLDEFLGSHMPELPDQEDMIPMYIVTNQQQINGASVLLYDGILDRFSQQYPGNYYILPSSIHEVLFIPSGRIKDEDELFHIVEQANMTVVSLGEQLSDSVYYYEEGSGMIMPLDRRSGPE